MKPKAIVSARKGRGQRESDDRGGGCRKWKAFVIEPGVVTDFRPERPKAQKQKESGSTAADDGCRDDIEKCENEHRTCDDDGLRVTMMMAMREVECGRWKPGEMKVGRRCFWEER